MTYLDILNEHADSKETILTVLELLESKYNGLRGMSEYLIVVGDAKTFNHLVTLKRESLHGCYPFQAIGTFLKFPPSDN